MQIHERTVKPMLYFKKKKIMKKINILILTSIMLIGCSTASTIQKVSASNSEFDDAIFDGETSVINDIWGLTLHTPNSILNRFVLEGERLDTYDDPGEEEHE